MAQALLNLPMLEKFDPEYVRQAALTVGHLQVHTHFGGEFTRDQEGKVQLRPGISISHSPITDTLSN